MTVPKAPDPARSRFAALTLLRLGAIALIAFGAALAAGRVAWVDAGLAFPIGLIMVGIGLFDMIVFVPLLTRRWRSGGENPD